MLHLSKVNAFLIYFLLFFVPLIFLPYISLSFEPPKVLASELVIGLLCAYTVFTGLFKLSKMDKKLNLIICSLFLLSLFHLIFDPSRGNLFGNVFRLQGTILFWFLLALTLVAQNTYFRLKQRYIYFSGFLAIVISGFVFGDNSAGRWIGSLGEPNALAAVIVMIFPFVFLSFKNFWIKALTIILSLVVINFSESRSGLIGFGLELLFITIIKIFKERYKLAVIVCGILVTLSLILPIVERQYFLKTNTNPYILRFEDRAEIWEAAVNAGLSSPIYGSGLESIQEQIRMSAKKMNANSQHQIIDSSHNFILDFWIWGGAIGVLLMVYLIILTLKNLIKKKLVIETTIFIGLLSVLSFNPTTVVVLVGFWWVIGRSFSQDPEKTV
jgi:O-antigen ligase